MSAGPPARPAAGRRRPSSLWPMLRAHAAPPAPPCPRCGQGYPIAPACVAADAPIPPDACPRCLQPRRRCAACDAGAWRVRRTRALLGYKRGDVERLVLAAKRLEPWAIGALARVLAGWLLAAAGRARYDMVLPVPFHHGALRGRAAHPLTAIYLDARPAVWPQVAADDLAPALLRQIRARPARLTLSEPARWRTAHGAMRLGYPTRILRGARVLLIDDVLTSGATINECARVLLDDGGAACVDAAVLARQPWRPRRAPEAPHLTMRMDRV
jgi:predicted amidophosphoribosyltransferase